MANHTTLTNAQKPQRQYRSSISFANQSMIVRQHPDNGDKRIEITLTSDLECARVAFWAAENIRLREYSRILGPDRTRELFKMLTELQLGTEGV